MPRINKIDLDQINRQFDRADTLEKLVQQLQENQKNLKIQLGNLDFEHGKSTTNNLVFTWTGSNGAGHTELDWSNGVIQDKNATAQSVNINNPLLLAKKSSAPGVQHNYP